METDPCTGSRQHELGETRYQRALQSAFAGALQRALFSGSAASPVAQYARCSVDHRDTLAICARHLVAAVA